LHAAQKGRKHVSIPRSEFWLFGLSSVCCRWIIGKQVSIPRSEFWLFGHIEIVSPDVMFYLFQFPARNSGCSDKIHIRAARTDPDGFNSPLGILVVRTPILPSFHLLCMNVSIPRSEFWLFGHSRWNGLVNRVVLFQFPARNSGCSDRRCCYSARDPRYVSIPRSEFWLFGLHLTALPNRCSTVSIPRSEFWLFGLSCSTIAPAPVRMFQFPARNSGCSDLT